MMLGRMICLIEMEIKAIAWLEILWLLDWERRSVFLAFGVDL